jgi:ferritin-like metal-binding protein YciE
MTIAGFRDMYLAELQELRSVEAQLLDALQNMADAASHVELKSALLNQRSETETRKKRLDDLLGRHGADPRAHTDQAMQAMVRESGKMMSLLEGKNLRDAGIISSAQRVEHYGIAAYGTAAALAGQLDLRDDQKVLHESLEEERRADALLSDLAKQTINPAAVGAAA